MNCSGIQFKIWNRNTRDYLHFMVTNSIRVHLNKYHTYDIFTAYTLISFRFYRLNHYSIKIISHRVELTISLTQSSRNKVHFFSSRKIDLKIKMWKSHRSRSVKGCQMGVKIYCSDSGHVGYGGFSTNIENDFRGDTTLPLFARSEPMLKKRSNEVTMFDDFDRNRIRSHQLQTP